MNSSDLHSMSLNSSGDFSYNNVDLSNQFHSFQQNSESSNVQPDLKHISLIDEEKMGAFIEALEKVYKKLVQKVCYRYIPQTLESKRIIPDRKSFNSEKMLNELNKVITTETDSLQVWIRWNITERNDIIVFKKWLIEKEEQKLRKRQEINILTDKIAAKLKQKTLQKLIDDFTRTRKEKYQKFIQNDKLSVQQQKIKNLFNNVSQVEKNFQKAQEKVDEFTRGLQMKTGQNLNKIDHLFS